MPGFNNARGPMELCGTMYGYLLDTAEDLLLRMCEKRLTPSDSGYLAVFQPGGPGLLHTSRIGNAPRQPFDGRRRLAEARAHHLAWKAGEDLSPPVHRSSRAFNWRDSGDSAAVAIWVVTAQGIPVILSLAIGSRAEATEALLLALAIERHLIPPDEMAAWVSDPAVLAAVREIVRKEYLPALAGTS